MTAERWRTGNTRPHTVWRDLGGVGHDERLAVFDDPEDARRAVDAVNGAPSVDDIARAIDEAFDADFESRMSGGGGASREDMARDAAERVVELWPAQPVAEGNTVTALADDVVLDADGGKWLRNGETYRRIVGYDDGAPVLAGGRLLASELPVMPPTTPPSCDCPTTDGADPAGSAVGQRGAPTPYDLVEANERALTDIRFRDVWTAVATSMARGDHPSRVAHLALAALRDGGADGGGEDVAPASSAERLRRAADALAARASEWYGSAAVADGVNKLVYEARRVAAEPWVPRTDGYELCNEPHPDGKHRPCVKTQGHNAHRDGRGDFWESLRTTPDEADIARLATALGVSLDPDDPDPVGRLVEAAGKAREVEVVSGPVGSARTVTVTLPSGDHDVEAVDDRGEDSIVPGWSMEVVFTGSGVAAWNDGISVDGDLDEGARVDAYERDALRLLAAVHAHRQLAAAPAALAVGDELPDADALRRAKAGTLVEQANRVRGLVCGQEHHRSVHWTTGRTCSLRPGELDWPAEAAWPMHVVYVPNDAARVGTGGSES